MSSPLSAFHDDDGQWSGDMLPSLEIDDVVNQLPRHAEFCGEMRSGGFAKRVAFTNCDNGEIRQFGLPAALSARHSLRVSPRTVPVTERTAPFGYHVADVVYLSPKEEVGRIAAWRIIARMQNLDRTGNRAVHEGPHRTMRQPPASLSSEAFFPAAATNNSVAVTIALPGIRPTRLRSVYLRPEFFREVHPILCVGIS